MSYQSSNGETGRLLPGDGALSTDGPDGDDDAETPEPATDLTALGHDAD